MLVLFDVDGTLLSGAGQAHLAAMADAVEDFAGPRPDVKSVGDRHFVAGKQINGFIDTQIVPMMCHSVGASASPRLCRAILAQMGVSYRRRLDGGEGCGTPLAGALDLATALNGRYGRTGLATGNTHRVAKLKLSTAGFAGVFSCGGFADGNPDRVAVVADGVRHAKVGETIWLVGDTPADVRAARENGIRVLAVTTGSFAADELREADLVCASLQDSVVREIFDV